MHKRVLLILLIWFLAVMITVPILVIFDVIGADQGRDPLRTILGLAFLLLAAGAVFLGLSGARPTLAMLVPALMLALLGLAIAGWLPVAPPSSGSPPGQTFP